ncbi:MAG TPA: hypothetical protein VD770_03665 [Coxiellaceae bacterium]|nr:hypothetical protein [Coxiellaceae bacterium]
MPLIARSDGIQFVLQPYRELIQFNRKSMLIPKVQMLSHQQGQFVRLFRKSADQMEGVFSREPGYLLGECINQHFGRLQNLIFCEDLPDEHVLLVIIRNGDVHLDAKINVSHLQTELASVLVTGDKFHIFISGSELPISQKPESGKISLPEASVLSFAILEEPVFPRLVVSDAFRLLPVPLALKSAQVTQIPPMVWSIAASVLAIIVIAVIVHKYRVAAEIPKLTAVITAAPKVYPYQAYYAALSTPAPAQILQELASIANTLNFIPGWSVNQLSYSNAQYQVQLQGGGASIRLLDEWVAKNKFRMQINASGVRLSRISNLSIRNQPKSIYDNQQLIKLLLDRLGPLVGRQAISLGASSTHNAAKETSFNLTLSNVSPQFLLLLSQELQGLPISLSSINFAMHNGLLSGSINLSVWGS